MMEYKKCEFCGEKLHIRSRKCPFCNRIVDETPKEIENDDVSEEINSNKDLNISENSTEIEKNQENRNITDNLELDNNEKNDSSFDFSVGMEEPKDYIYKAEVRHSLEYTKPLSNWVKVFVTAFSTFPLIGQLTGAFLGVFFSTYEDQDRSSFGKALIAVSIGMFLFYIYNIKQFVDIVNSGTLDQLINSIK